MHYPLCYGETLGNSVIGRTQIYSCVVALPRRTEVLSAAARLAGTTLRTSYLRTAFRVDPHLTGATHNNQI